MNKTPFVMLATWLTLSSGALARADDASMVLADGTRLSFELVRSGARSRTPLGSGVTVGSGEGYRLLFDSRARRFFGYTVKATPLPKGGFRLELGPLAPEAVTRIARQHQEMSGESLVGESLAIAYPPPEEVRDDEPLLLELMTNPATGEKLSDIIRVSDTRTKAVPSSTPLAVKDAVLTLNGKAQPATASAAGRYLWFALPGRGRFVFGLEASPGRSFLPAELAGNRLIRFGLDGETFAWTSAAPIVQATPVPKQLWVWHDVGFKAPGSFMIGAMSELPQR